MSKIVSWVKANKLSVLLLLLVGFLLVRNFNPPLYRSAIAPSLVAEKVGYEPAAIGGLGMALPPAQEFAPAPEAEERLLVKESSLSLLVKDVPETQQEIISQAEEAGGYLVSSSISHPEEARAATGRVTVRVPEEKLNQVLDSFRSLAVKVVSENLSGQDVTDEYVDIQARLETLNKTKTKFEEILTQATEVDDLLRVQRELINLQQQIDNLKGREKYLTQTAVLSRVSLYLATDELELPYAPSAAWRPKVIFKQAVRSLVATFRKLGSLVIWVGVYALVWGPVLVIYLLLRRRKKKLVSPPKNL